MRKDSSIPIVLRIFAEKITNMAKKTYDPRSATSILNHGMMLLGKSLREVHPEADLLGGKGGLGKAVEKYHYEYEPNSEAEPDFAEAGLELKCTPLKMLNDHSMAAKERLVLNIINYMDEAQCAFSSSSFWHKNKFLLLMFYLHETGVNPVDMLFKLIRTWQFPEEDLKIITDDWNTIHDKIMRGEAHLLTEGDTFYLAACMKGSQVNAEMRKQPFSDKPAQQRAYSLKQGYINKIILDSFLDHSMLHQLSISSTRVDALRKKYASDKIVQSVNCYKPKETFEQLVERRLSPFYGKTIEEIGEETHTSINLRAKSFAYNAIRAMLSIQTQRIQEFENAGITVKSIALEAKEDKVKESMSFPYIRFADIINQEWEESDWHQTLSSKFLFVVFRKSPDNDRGKMRLIKVFFWNMPCDDLLHAEKLWADTKEKVAHNDYDHFITSLSHGICHVRPHGTRGQKVSTPQGQEVQPKCFWLNKGYILSIVKEHLADSRNKIQ